jgi:hypothetical protein
MNTLYPEDAPFVVDVVPRGWDTPMTQAEADEANLLYPVPPYGQTYWDPGNENPILSEIKFIHLSDIEAGNPTVGHLREGDAEKLDGKDTITIWPIAGRAGILDDLPARAVRILNRTGNQLTFNLDSDGLNVTGLKFLGIVDAS